MPDNFNSSINNLVGTFGTVNIEQPQLIDNSNLICIDTNNSRIGINTINPDYSIDIKDGIINIPQGGLYIDGSRATIDNRLSSSEQTKLQNFLSFIEISGNNIKFSHPSESNNTNYFELDFGSDENSEFNVKINSDTSLNLKITGLSRSRNSDSPNLVGVKKGKGYLQFNNVEDYEN